MFKRVKFFGRAISNDEKVEKEIEIQREAVQLTDVAHASRGIPIPIAVDAYTKTKYSRLEKSLKG